MPENSNETAPDSTITPAGFALVAFIILVGFLGGLLLATLGGANAAEAIQTHAGQTIFMATVQLVGALICAYVTLRFVRGMVRKIAQQKAQLNAAQRAAAQPSAPVEPKAEAAPAPAEGGSA